MSTDLRQEIIFYGAGYPDTAKLAEKLARTGIQISVHGYLDDIKQGRVLDYPIIGGRDVLKEIDVTRYKFVNNVFGSTKDRLSITELLKDHGCDVVSLIDPDVDLAHAETGTGLVIASGVQMGARVKIGDFCAIRMGAIVNHDNVLDDHVFVGPGVTLCGGVKLHRGVFLGAGSVVLPHVTIGAFATIGAGAVVTQDVATEVTVAGVPARVVS
jgi:sugar O-acyltransferase (sialic acid O-acetyltransferase NeuD family)